MGPQKARSRTNNRWTSITSDRAVNICLGSALSTIGLTAPAVLGISLILGTPVELGLDSAELILLMLTLVNCILTFRGQQTNVLQGTVRSSRMDKTITVSVVRRFKHPKYGKYVLRTKRYYVHDEKNDARPGDTVVISETRPLSKTKRWRLVEILERAPTREDRKS